MREQLEKRVKKHLKNKRDFFVVATVFLGVTAILFMISFQATNYGSTRFWIRFPSLILLFVLAIIYVSTFGFRRMEEALYDEEDEIDDLVSKLFEYKTRNKSPKLDLTEEERLELLELEELKEKLERD